MASTANSCRKTESALRSPHEQCSSSGWFVRALFGFSMPKGEEKNFSALYPRNPLKSIDSDERIQGNPNKSNP
jgi:hypothetical protein